MRVPCAGTDEPARSKRRRERRGAPAAELEAPARRAAADGVAPGRGPMVGTFYRASQPGAPPFVEEGDAVASGQTLCILEAMKLMNEVKAEIEGIVRTIHVGNAAARRVRPAPVRARAACSAGPSRL